jgi:hypothetical protein
VIAAPGDRDRQRSRVSAGLFREQFCASMALTREEWDEMEEARDQRRRRR